MPAARKNPHPAVAPPASARPAASARAAKEPAALARFNKALDSAQKELVALRKDVGRGVSAGTRDLHKGLQKMIREARRDGGKLGKTLQREAEQLQKRLSRSPASKASPPSRSGRSARGARPPRDPRRSEAGPAAPRGRGAPPRTGSGSRGSRQRLAGPHRLAGSRRQVAPASHERRRGLARAAGLEPGDPPLTSVVMKAGIHPEYVLAHVRCSCGNEFYTRSTKPELHVEICSACHPFYTGKQKLVDTGGRVERFKRRAAPQQALRPARPRAGDEDDGAAEAWRPSARVGCRRARLDGGPAARGGADAGRACRWPAATRRWGARRCSRA